MAAFKIYKLSRHQEMETGGVEILRPAGQAGWNTG